MSLEYKQPTACYKVLCLEKKNNRVGGEGGRQYRTEMKPRKS